MNGISIIICTFNGKEKLGSTLEHILKLKSKYVWELIIVDNASTDNTPEFCSEVLSGKEIQIKWRIIREYKKGLNYARICGLMEAQYDIVLFCDDDNLISENYIEVGSEIMQAHPKIGALGGHGFPIFESDKPEWFDRYAHSFAVGPQSKTDGKIIELPAELYGAGTFFRKAPLLNFFNRGLNTLMTDRIGKSLASGGDVEWCFIVQLACFELWYDHRLTFKHVMPDSRMKWTYYLRLKRAIASGSGQLLPYACLIRNPKIGLLSYAVTWLKKAFHSSLVYLKHKLRATLISNPLTIEDELAIIILHSKMQSYWSKGASGFRHFQKLKKLH